SHIDVSAALSCPGVVAVFPRIELGAEGLKAMWPPWVIRSRDGRGLGGAPPVWAPRRLGRHGGGALPAGLAHTRGQGLDAAEYVAVKYETLPAVIDVRGAQTQGAPPLHVQAASNICFRFARGDEGQVRIAFASAAHAVALELINNRLVGAAIEPRA